MKKIPMRTCVVTKEKMPKKELIRVVTTESGIVIDETGKVNGHGVYLKKDENVIKLAKDKKILNHELGVEVPDDIFDKLLEITQERGA
jgi:predicted RNA-binding protein YlxR (DUF448 family)